MSHCSSLHRARHRCAPPATARLATIATLFASLLIANASASDFFDERAVAMALSPGIPAGWLFPAVPAAALASSGPATLAATADVATDNATCPRLLQQTYNRLQTGEAQSLCQYQGQVLLIVNTASFCGYTKQYEGLEALYRRYRDRGLVVVGFPSNDFGGQEPGTNKEIAEFCRTTYGVQFPLYEKTTVARLAGNPLYADLARATGHSPRWNFHKYVVDRNGTPVASFASDVTPDSPAIIALLEKLLKQKPSPART